MPHILDYSSVLQHMRSAGFQCLYPNSGAFGFPSSTSVHIVGWIGPDDPTIKPEMLPFTRQIAPPYERTLSRLVCHAWLDLFPGPLWLMPRSHWAYELQHGCRPWLADLLIPFNLDVPSLTHSPNAATLEFPSHESDSFEHFLTSLLAQLQSTDFAIAFPAHSILGLVHSHKQIWWMSADPLLCERLNVIADI